MTKDCIAIDSVSALLMYLPDICEADTYFFRGHGDKAYELTPSIYRKVEWISNEHRIVREILMRCPQEFISMSSSFEKLVKMQHYDLPTRLLDITENPLVALYFACEEQSESTDGEILCFSVPKKDVKYYDSDTVSLVANIAWLDQNFQIEASYAEPRYFHNETNVHANKLIQTIRQEKPYFLERINPDDIMRVLCVKPKMDNQRVIRQDGAFFLFGMNKFKNAPAEIEQSWHYHPDEFRLIITKDKKKELRRQLRSLGISSAKLFPEIDMVAKYLKDEYGFNEEKISSTEQPIFTGQIKVSR